MHFLSGIFFICGPNIIRLLILVLKKIVLLIIKVEIELIKIRIKIACWKVFKNKVYIEVI